MAAVEGVLRYAERVLTALRLTDAMTHVSIRLPGGRTAAATPGWEVAAGQEPAILDLDGNGVARSARPSPLVVLDLAVYRRQPEVGAVALLAPRLACAFGIARRPFLPLPHTGAELAAQVAFCEMDRLPLSAHQADRTIEDAGPSRILHLPGIGVLVTARDVDDLLMTAFNLEYSLARMNFVSAGLRAPKVRGVTPAESAAIVARRQGHHYRAFFESLVAGAGASAAGTEAGSNSDEDGIRRKMAASCRMLYAQGTLVAFAEHISHRLPGTDQWLMSRAGNFGLMRPEDMAVLDGRAARVRGPDPPPFRFFHADIFRARPDVVAIVHTHDVYGRAFAQAGFAATPVWRCGAAVASEEVALFAQADLLFDLEPRRRAVEALGSRAILHEIAHGTDFVGATLEATTVRAIHREELLRMRFLSLQLGEPRRLAAGVLRDLDAIGPSDSAWWRYYAVAASQRNDPMQLAIL